MLKGLNELLGNRRFLGNAPISGARFATGLFVRDEPATTVQTTPAPTHYESMDAGFIDSCFPSAPTAEHVFSPSIHVAVAKSGSVRFPGGAGVWAWAVSMHPPIASRAFPALEAVSLFLPWLPKCINPITPFAQGSFIFSLTRAVGICDTR